jgi:quercetin dioxygenase-like cupin family protein
MKIKPCGRVEQQTVLLKGAKGCTVRWLISDCDGATNFAMRQFELAPGGHTPQHTHPYEHEVYVLEGEGVVLEGETEHAVQAGDVIFVCPDEVHQFRNPHARPFKFLCLVPNAAAQQPSTGCAECQVSPAPPKE